MNLWYDFKTNNKKTIHKWWHYFPIYEKHFSQWRNKTLKILEIGIDQGGSLQMWQRFFGPFATIVGVDINSECKKHEEENIHVRIGDQSDVKFLDLLDREFGTFDIVIDDGSHIMKDIVATFNYFYPKISKNGIYLVEDLHTAYWPECGGGSDKQSTFINICKKYIDSLNAHHTRGVIAPDIVSNNTSCISFYDSVVVFERGTLPMCCDTRTGKDI